jgi:hypothetical protein
MRRIICALAAVLMVATLACSPRDRRETASSLDSAAIDVEREVEEGAEDVREEFRDYSYNRRDQFRRDVNQALQRLDQEIADLERTTKRGTDPARDSALVHIRGVRKDVNRRMDRFATATENNWEEVRRSISASVDSLDLAVRAQRPDARPMGGAGPT